MQSQERFFPFEAYTELLLMLMGVVCKHQEENTLYPQLARLADATAVKYHSTSVSYYYDITLW